MQKSNKERDALGFKLEQVLRSMAPPRTTKRIGLPMAGRKIFKEIEAIVYCKSDGNYSEVYFTDGSHEVVTLKLKKMEELIDDITTFFGKCHLAWPFK